MWPSKLKLYFDIFMISGSPFQFLVTDYSKVTVRGDGLGLVRVNQLANFLVVAPPAQLKDININITGALSVQSTL